MIRRILTYYAASLDEYLHHKFQQPEGMAEVGIIGSGASEKPCKLIVSLVNIERETASRQASVVTVRTICGRLRRYC